MATCDFWTERFVPAENMYTCAWCDKHLKAKISNSEKNPGKVFVSCSKDYGGCGLFSFLDAPPNDKFKPGGGGAQKRGRAPAQSLAGPVAAAPPNWALQLAALATQVADTNAAIAELEKRVTMLEEN